MEQSPSTAPWLQRQSDLQIWLHPCIIANFDLMKNGSRMRRHSAKPIIWNLGCPGPVDIKHYCFSPVRFPCYMKILEFTVVTDTSFLVVTWTFFTKPINCNMIAQAVSVAIFRLTRICWRGILKSLGFNSSVTQRIIFWKWFAMLPYLWQHVC